MRRAYLFAPVQMKCVVGNIAVDVRKQVFVGRDAEAGRSVLPFDCESAPCINVGKRAHWAFIRLNMPIASNSYPMAPGTHQSDARRERNSRNLLHVSVISPVTMPQRVVLDSEKS